MKEFFAENHIPVLMHAPYSPYLIPCDSCQFFKLKNALKRTNFQSMNEVKAKRTINDELHNLFLQWESHMQRCIGKRRENVEGNKSQL